MPVSSAMILSRSLAYGVDYRVGSTLSDTDRTKSALLYISISTLLLICTAFSFGNEKPEISEADRVTGLHQYFASFQNVVMPAIDANVLTVDGWVLPLRFDVFPDSAAPGDREFRADAITFMLVDPSVLPDLNGLPSPERPFYIATSTMTQSQAAALQGWRSLEDGYMEYVRSELRDIGGRYLDWDVIDAIVAHDAQDPDVNVLDLVKPESRFLVRYVMNGSLPVLCADLTRASQLLASLSFRHQRAFRLPTLGEWYCALGLVRNRMSLDQILDDANLFPGNVSRNELFDQIRPSGPANGDRFEFPNHMIGNVREAVYLSDRERSLLNRSFESSVRGISLGVYHYTTLAVGGSVFTLRDRVREELDDVNILLLHRQHVRVDGVPRDGFDTGLRPVLDIPHGVIGSR